MKSKLLKIKNDKMYILVNDAMDSIMDGSDDEAEQDAIVNNVLEEIGIDMNMAVSVNLINN